MKKNIGKYDKGIRIIIGVSIMFIGIINQSWWGAIGLIPVLTALAGFCPIYTLLKISSCNSCTVNEKPVKTGTPKP
ncbi:DUF2892 domain-containing protein [Chlorobium sp. BLA1]|uniref:YgaP family membrane protein n=1 Tax=Candidatus Chlorobium masyuteum TaxID=2716876 RepID=UPI0014205353|nr:DUF2892 domain-containing protein [Candidatus Chlorobium masyuteum]NHQ60902.1 DUF2892 domain-containing protein [Candidatus Chlorobium masyuteum]NTU44186.1 DUF2892 domain-containing protein [Chlorobiaceae bacterium]